MRHRVVGTSNGLSATWGWRDRKKHGTFFRVSIGKPRFLELGTLWLSPKGLTGVQRKLQPKIWDRSDATFLGRFGLSFVAGSTAVHNPWWSNIDCKAPLPHGKVRVGHASHCEVLHLSFAGLLQRFGTRHVAGGL